jgi:hypothetical protein
VSCHKSEEINKVQNLFRNVALFSAMTMSGISSINNLENPWVIPQNAVQRVVLTFEDGKFSAAVDGKIHQIHPDDISGLPQELTRDKLEGFLNHGYLSLTQIGDDYGIRAHLRLLGGMENQLETTGGFIFGIAQINYAAYKKERALIGGIWAFGSKVAFEGAKAGHPEVTVAAVVGTPVVSTAASYTILDEKEWDVAFNTGYHKGVRVIKAAEQAVVKAAEQATTKAATAIMADPIVGAAIPVSVFLPSTAAGAAAASALGMGGFGSLKWT